MKICILAMFGLLALANSAPQRDLEPKRHENTKEKREASAEWDLQEGEPGITGYRAYAYAYPGYQTIYPGYQRYPAYRPEEQRAKRSAPDIWDMVVLRPKGIAAGIVNGVAKGKLLNVPAKIHKFKSNSSIKPL